MLCVYVTFNSLTTVIFHTFYPIDIYMADVIQVGMGDTPTATPRALVVSQSLSHS